MEQVKAIACREAETREKGRGLVQVYLASLSQLLFQGHATVLDIKFGREGELLLEVESVELPGISRHQVIPLYQALFHSLGTMQFLGFSLVKGDLP